MVVVMSGEKCSRNGDEHNETGVEPFLADGDEPESVNGGGSCCFWDQVGGNSIHSGVIGYASGKDPVSLSQWG